MSNEIVSTIFGLIGGLAIFLFGMNLMSDNLQKAAGDRMKQILGMLTRNPVLGVLAGALTTAVLQSSSATTVMVIGFASAGLMTLPQAISVILGANIGTTMTAQLLAFKISDYIYPIIFIGFLISFVSKNEKVKAVGTTIFAFGLLFEGIEIMGSVMKPLASSEVFVNLLGKVTQNRFLGLLLGAVMTLTVQSSSATIAVLQNFAATPLADGVTSIIGLKNAIPVLLGDNIGTTITALLACIGQSKDAKRTAVAHATFNISGAAIFIWFIGPYAQLIQKISPSGNEVDVIARQIANAHTGFNLTMTILWTPMIWLLVKIVTRIVPDKQLTGDRKLQVMFLDRNSLGQPVAAMHLVAEEMIHCGQLTRELIADTSAAVHTEGTKITKSMTEKSEAIHMLNQEIANYMGELYSTGVLTEEQAIQTAALMHTQNDLNRIAVLLDDLAVNLVTYTGKKANRSYSRVAVHGIRECLDLIEVMLDNALLLITSKDPELYNDIRAQSDYLLNVELKLRKEHITRVKNGECNKELTGPFNEVFHALERMCSNCSNIAEASLVDLDFDYFYQSDLISIPFDYLSQLNET